MQLSKMPWYNKYSKLSVYKEPDKPREKALYNHLIAYLPDFPFLSGV